MFSIIYFFQMFFQLFLFLQDFSQRMLSKTHEIEKQLDSLIRDTKATDSRLHTVFNDFLMLSNTQFIENVTYTTESVFILIFLCGFGCLCNFATNSVVLWKTFPIILQGSQTVFVVVAESVR